MVKTVSIAEYQAAKTAGGDPTMVDRIYALNIQTVDEGDALGLVKGKVRQAVEEAGLPATDDDIGAAAEGIWAQLGRPGAVPTREHTYTVDASGEVRDWRRYSKRAAEPTEAVDGEGEPGVTHHRITDDEPRFSGAGASDGDAQQQSLFLIPSDGQFNGKLYRDAPELANIAERLIGEHGHLRELINCQIRYFWRRKTGVSKGRVKIGYCKRASDLLGHFTGCDFIIWLSATTARDGKFTDRQVEAAIFHQLCHIETDDEGNFISARHDFEGFAAEVRQYGTWTEDLKLGGTAFVAAQQMGLFDVDEGIEDDDDEEGDDEPSNGFVPARAARGDSAGVLIHPDGTPLTDEEIAEQEAAEARGEFDDEWDDEEEAKASRAMSAASGIAVEDDDDAEVVI